MNKAALLEKLSTTNKAYQKQWYHLMEAWEEQDKELPDWEMYQELNQEVFSYWFGDTEKEKKFNEHFISFGQAGEGSQATIWLLEGRDFSNAPVALIGSEGEVSVVAPNYTTFMILCGMGYSLFELHEIGEGDEETEADAYQPWLDWIKNTFDLDPIEDVSAVVNAARATHPDLETYLDI